MTDAQERRGHGGRIMVKVLAPEVSTWPEETHS